MIRAIFGGVPVLSSVSFNMRLGTAPSSGSISFPVQYSPPLYGNLVLQDDYNVITIQNLYLINPIRTQSESGDIIQATLVDRRYFWQFGTVFAQYNLEKDAEGKPIQEKSLIELLNLAFAAYGLTPSYLGTIPDEYPAADWDFVNPTVVIEEICNKYSLAVSLDLHGNPWVVPIDYVRSFPPGEYISREYKVIQKPKPRWIYVVGNRIINQRTFTLEPVGIEPIYDGDVVKEWKIKKIDELSYTPPGGWGGEGGYKHYMLPIAKSGRPHAEEECRLADKCIYKWYAWIPNDESERDEVLPWEGFISEKEKRPSALGEIEERARPYIETDTAVNFDDSAVKESSGLWKSYKGFEVDPELGIVKFEKRLVKGLTGDVKLKMDNIEPATVKLTIGYEMKSKNDGWNTHYHYDYFAGGILPPLIHKNSSLTLYYKNGTIYEAAQKTALDNLSKKLIDVLLKRFEDIPAAEYVYARLMSVIPYGQFKSVTWNLGESQCNTVISKGREEVRPFLPSYGERVQQKKTVALHWPSEAAVGTNKERKRILKRIPGIH